MRMGPGIRATWLVLGLSAHVSAAPVAPHRSASELVSSNGRAVVGYDVAQQRVTSFLEHPYRARSDGSVTRDVAFDVYPGLRVGTTGQWLSNVAPESVQYEPGTGIIRVHRVLPGLSLDEYTFAPIELAERAFLSLVRVERTDASTAPLSGYLLFNFHLGGGSPEPDAAGETIAWNAGAESWLEWGASGLTLAYSGITSASHRGASPDNPFAALECGVDISDGNGATGDDQVAGLQWSLPALAQGEVGWFGGFVVLDSTSDVLPHVDAVKSWIAGRTAEELVADEIAAWKSWHTPEPSGLSANESALLAQQMAILRMGQVRGDEKDDGQILASLPPGNWNITWVRDMAYATVALVRAGHGEEARRAIQFQLSADSSKYEEYVGAPYQISITRYFGDGVEETDSNENGPNIEFDGFGLFLWVLAEYVEATNDDPNLATWWPLASEKVGDVLLHLQQESGLISADSSIWEVHWNGQQKRFAYTTLTAANGLCRAAKLADRVGDATRSASYREAGKRARDALTQLLAAPDGTLAQSQEDLAAGTSFLDAAAIEAAGFGLVDPKGKATSATLASMRQKLVPASGRGFMRNDDGGWYDSQEWVFVDLRSAAVMNAAGDAEGAELVDWITAQGTENFGLISELHDAATADYAGEMPMVGFGAGAYALALQSRGQAVVPACDEFAPEPTGAGTGGTSGAGGTSANPGDSDDEDDSGCGCGTSNHDANGLLALVGLTLFVARRRMRTVS
jgi:MYXO-CTERM domain-containing protein